MFKRIVLAICVVTAFTGCEEAAQQDPDGGNPKSCPATEPNFTQPQSCEGDVRCSYGTESCCGETYDSFVCNCRDGEFSCFFTDACLGAFTQCPEEYPCSKSECGDIPDRPDVTCGDGSTGILRCERAVDATCNWVGPLCSEDLCDLIDCGAGVCELQEVQCVQPPCLPQAVCVQPEG